MWRNYLTVGLRALARNKTYAFINIFGLALGLAACVMILLYVRYETSYDSWMEGADNAFQVQTFYKATESGGEEMKLQVSAIVTGRALEKDYPGQIEKLVWVRSFSPIVIQNGEASEIEDLRMVDENLFEIFRVPFLRGSWRSALPDAHSIALSESEAKRRFGDADPVGKTLTIVDNAGNVDYRVTSVFKDLPKNSHFTAQAVARFDLGVQFADRPSALTSWNNQQGWNYVRLRSPNDVDLIHSQMPAWEKRNIPDEDNGEERSNAGEVQDFRLANITDVHLGEAQDASVTPGNDRTTVITFAVIAFLVLGMASVNFTNLATARASQRAREVALRKVLGASRKQLVLQFLGESVLVAAIAMIFALAAVELLLPYFNTFLDADIRLGYRGADGVILPLLLLVLVVGAIGGLYPALYLARFQPARILKANKSSADAEGSGRLRNVLVVAQFAVSIGLIICTAVIYSQTLFARNAESGYVRDGLLQVGNLGFRGVDNRDGQVTEQIRRIPGVQAAARTQIGIDPGGNSTTSVYPLSGTQSTELGDYSVEADFFRTMGMEIVAGRDFSEAQGRDDITTPSPDDPGYAATLQQIAQRGVNIIVTEEAARRLGFRSPQEAVGKNFRSAIAGPKYGLVPLTVVGVVRDARFRSVHEPLQPIMYTMRRNGFGDIMIRYSGDPAAIRDQVETVWKRNIPQVPFNGRFAEDIVREQYEREEGRGQLFAAFAVLAVVIACLGLFGLAAFTAERRTKEIGIRKVLGARSRDIVRLLAWQFSKPVIVANLIAWPLAWWVMRDWLNGFDARINLGPTPFLLAGVLALAIALGTITGHALKVARANPIHALRYE
ncbi:MAG: ABC transporter permease [Pseudomonadota bacterium]|nr:ABC transporter permease [Pseudomonadota bacterium]